MNDFYRWHDWNDLKHMTGVISQKHWSWELTYIDRTDQLNICVILDLGWFLIGKKRRAIIVMNENAYVWTIRRYKTLNFFQPNIKTYPKLCMTAEIRLQYRIDQLLDMLYVIRYVKCYVRNVKHENKSLIVPMMILQAKTTSHSEKSVEDTEEKRQSKGMLSRNTPYVWRHCV